MQIGRMFVTLMSKIVLGIYVIFRYCYVFIGLYLLYWLLKHS